MAARIETLCEADREMMMDFSRRCIARLGDHLSLKLLVTVFGHFLDANVLKEIDKDRLIIEHAAAAFGRGSSRESADAETLFEMTKSIDQDFLRRFSSSLFSIRMRYADFAAIRKERILSYVDLVFDLLGNWHDGMSFSEAVKRTFPEERYAGILGHILHLYNLETKILGNSLTFHGPAAKLKDLFAEKLFVVMEAVGREIAADYARRAYEGTSFSRRGFGFSQAAG